MENKARHTSGPWIAHGVVRPIWAQPLVNEDGYSIDQSLPANARLIAAAPELLDVLMSVIVALEDCPFNLHGAEGLALIERARAIVSEAKGDE